MHDEFLEKLYAEERNDRGVDLILNYICDLLDGHGLQAIDDFMVAHGASPVLGHTCTTPSFEAVDQLLREADLDRLNTTYMVGLLSAPFSAREHLAEYKPLLGRIRAKLSKTEPRKRVKALLQGFDR